VSDLDLSRLTVARAARALRARELSPLELTESYLRRIELLNPKINAYITVSAERARADARRATEDFAAGRIRGPLHGIPIALKDLFETEGIRTTGGAKIHADYVPVRDCTVAKRLEHRQPGGWTAELTALSQRSVVRAERLRRESLIARSSRRTPVALRRSD